MAKSFCQSYRTAAKPLPRVVLAISLIAGLLVVFHVTTSGFGEGKIGRLDHLSPWACVGGCGVGGSSAGGAGGAQWIGQGVSGGLIDAEVRAATSTVTAPGGGITRLRTVATPLFVRVHPGPFNLTLGMPLLWKSRPDEVGQISGNGDLSVILSKAFGMSGQARLDAGFTLPFGKAAVYDLSHKLLPSDMQAGSGVVSGMLGVDYTIDRDWGMYIAGVAYAPGLLYLRSSDKVWDDDLQRGIAGKKRLTSARKGLTAYENDVGVVQPDYLDAHGYVGIRTGGLTHSFGARCAIPLAHGSYLVTDHAIAPFDNYSKNSYPTPADLLVHLSQLADTTPRGIILRFPTNDTTTYEVISADSLWVVEKLTKRQNRQWVNLTLNYGMEIAAKQVPVFWAISLPVEFNRDDGVGVSGFGVEVGIRFVAY